VSAALISKCDHNTTIACRKTASVLRWTIGRVTAALTISDDGNPALIKQPRPLSRTVKKFECFPDLGKTGTQTSNSGIGTRVDPAACLESSMGGPRKTKLEIDGGCRVVRTFHGPPGWPRIQWRTATLVNVRRALSLLWLKNGRTIGPAGGCPLVRMICLSTPFPLSPSGSAGGTAKMAALEKYFAAIANADAAIAKTVKPGIALISTMHRE